MLDQILEPRNVWIQNRSTNDDEPNVINAANSSPQEHQKIQKSRPLLFAEQKSDTDSITFVIDESRTSTFRSSKRNSLLHEMCQTYIGYVETSCRVRSRVS